VLVCRNQFGPNCTTWLVAAEVFPTDVRATFQGTSAAMGKVGDFSTFALVGVEDFWETASLDDCSAVREWNKCSHGKGGWG
jgi:hypothetical protein